MFNNLTTNSAKKQSNNQELLNKFNNNYDKYSSILDDFEQARNGKTGYERIQGYGKIAAKILTRGN